MKISFRHFIEIVSLDNSLTQIGKKINERDRGLRPIDHGLQL